jgi:FkbM family methyltransferase
MNIYQKIITKLRIELRFFLEQRTGWSKPTDEFSIPKYVLKKYLPENPVIIDCGSHNGGDSVELARIFPAGKVYSFEAVPAIFSSMKHNTRRYKNIFPQQLALGNCDGEAEFYVSAGKSDASSSLMAPKEHLVDQPGVTFNNKIIVPVKKLDTWAREMGIDKIDFLWLDMQGFEYEMLKESHLILPTVTAILTEVSMNETYEGVLLYKDLKPWMATKGFKPVIEAIPEGSHMGNVLFTR